jgi:hypothetical protein
MPELHINTEEAEETSALGNLLRGSKGTGVVGGHGDDDDLTGVVRRREEEEPEEKEIDFS